MFIKVKMTALACAVSTIYLLSGCSGSNPDQGTVLSKTALPGVAVDGYLSGATVYIDFNNNGVRSAGEPSAVTDKDGFFSKAKDGTDYCAPGVDASLAKHCLSTSLTGNGLVLRTQGGFDVFTGEPFVGSLSTTVDVSGGTVAQKIISPLTSMLTNVSATDRAQILAAYGLAESDLDRDFLALANFDVTTTNAAIAFHKVVSIISKVFDTQYSAFGKESTFPTSSSGLVYDALAFEIAKGSKLNPSALTAAYNRAQTSIQNLYTRLGVNFPGPVSGVNVVANAAKILTLVDKALPATLAFSNVASRVIGVEMVVQKMQDNDPDVDAAITDAQDINSALYAKLSTTSDVDFSALTAINYAQAHNFNNIDISSATPLTSLANKQLYVVYDQTEKLGDKKSGSALFFFGSDKSGTSGSLNVCLKYNDGDNTKVDVQETPGTLIHGTWFSINPNRLVLTLEGSFDISLISKGMVGQKTKYSLSYGGDTVSWLSNQGLVDGLNTTSAVAEPTTNEGCVSLLAAKTLP